MERSFTFHSIRKHLSKEPGIREKTYSAKTIIPYAKKHICKGGIYRDVITIYPALYGVKWLRVDKVP